MAVIQSARIDDPGKELVAIFLPRLAPRSPGIFSGGSYGTLAFRRRSATAKLGAPPPVFRSSSVD